MNKAVNNKSKILYQLQKLRKLSQPFFLPIDQCNGFQFIWLLISLLFCVGGVVLVGLTGIISLLECIEQDANLLGHLLFVGSKIAKSKNLTNWRTVINTGAESGQTVFHLHIHFLSGRKMNWPPG